MADKKKADPEDQLEKAREERLKEGIAETQSHIDANEKMHRDAERKGAAEEPHRQEPPTSAKLVHSDRHAAEGATIAVDVGYDPDHPQDVHQEDLGMGPLKLHRDKKAVQQPAGRNTGAHTRPANTKEDGTPLVFDTGASGGGRPATGIGAQGAKVSGGSVVLTGGVGAGGVIMSDLPAGGPAALPVFSDRVISDPDMGGPQMVVPSGAVNPKRAEAPHHDGVTLVGADRAALPEKVASDRLLEPGERPQVISTTDSTNRERPHSGGGEALGMGPTEYHGYGKPAEEPKTSNEVKQQKAATKRSPAAATKKAKESGRKSDADLKTKVQRVTGTPQASSQSTKELKEATGMEIETKDVKENAATEQKDKPLETGTKAPEADEPKSE